MLGGASDTLAIKGNGAKVTASSTTITLDSSGVASGSSTMGITGNGTTLTASNTAIDFSGGQANDSLIINGTGNTVSASGHQITFNSAGSEAVAGDGNTIDLVYADNLSLSGTTSTQTTTIKGGGATVTSSTSGNFNVAGVGVTLNAADGSTITVTGGGEVLNVNNAHINVSSAGSLTIVGSNNQITVDPTIQASLTITGTSDAVTASNSSIAFLGANTGDTVTGPGDGGSNWFAPDPDLPPGDNGGYSPPKTGSNTMALRLSNDSDTSPAPSATAQQGSPSLQSLLHAMASFGAEGGAALSGTSTASHGTEHLHLAVAA